MVILAKNPEIVKNQELFGGLYRSDIFDYIYHSKEVEFMACERWISDTNFLDEFIHKPEFKVIVDCPTNSGKTKYVLETCLKSFDKFIYLADTVLLGQQVANKYNLPFYSADNQFEGMPKQFVTIYDHIWKFAPDKPSDYVLVCDEQHSIISQRGFRLETIKDLVGSFELFNRIIGLTGTYIPCEGWNDWSKIKIQVKNLPKHLVQFVAYEDELVTIANLAVKAVSEKNHQVLIYLQNKGDRLRKLKKALQTKNLSVVCVNADTTKGGEYDFLEGREIVLSEDFSQQVCITSYAQGYNIAPKTDKEFTFIAEPNRLNIDIVQAMNRIRTGLKDVYVLSNADEPTLRYDETLLALMQKEKERARKVYTEAKQKNRSNNWLDRQIRKEQLSEVLRPFGIDHFHLTFNVLEKLQTRLAKDSMLLETAYHAYDLETEQVTEQFDLEQIEIEEENYTLFLDKFYQLLEDEKRLTGSYKKFYTEYEEPLEAYLPYPEVKSFVYSCVESGKFNDELVRIKLWELEFNHAKYRKSATALKAILYQEIEENKFYPKGKFASTVIELSKAANLPLTPYTYLAAVKALFTLNDTSQRWNDRKNPVRGYIVTKK